MFHVFIAWRHWIINNQYVLAKNKKICFYSDVYNATGMQLHFSWMDATIEIEDEEYFNGPARVSAYMYNDAYEECVCVLHVETEIKIWKEL